MKLVHLLLVWFLQMKTPWKRLTQFQRDRDVCQWIQKEFQETILCQGAISLVSVGVYWFFTLTKKTIHEEGCLSFAVAFWWVSWAQVNHCEMPKTILERSLSSVLNEPKKNNFKSPNLWCSFDWAIQILTPAGKRPPFYVAVQVNGPHKCQ